MITIWTGHVLESFGGFGSLQEAHGAFLFHAEKYAAINRKNRALFEKRTREIAIQIAEKES